MKKTISLLILALVLFACSKGVDIVGTWVEPIYGQEPNMQGFTLKKNGEATSFNMATLQYHSWVKKGNTLTLQGVSIGNGVESIFSQTYLIKKLTENTLILEQDNHEIIFKLQK